MAMAMAMAKSETTSTSLQYRRMDTELVNNRFANKNKASSKSNQKVNQVPFDCPKDTVMLAYSPQALDKFGRLEASGMCNQIFQEDGRLQDMRRTAAYPYCTQLDQRNAEALTEKLVVGRARSKDGVSLEPRQFSDALEILRAKKRLLNSLQFAKDDDAETVESYLEMKFSDRGIRASARTNQQFEDNVHFKEVKDRYTYSLNISSRPLPSKQIVVLKPSPKLVETPEHVMCTCSSLHSHRSVKTKGRSARSTYFSFKEIKRRLKLANGENGEKHNWFSSVVSLHKISTKKRIQKEASDNKRPGSCRREHECDMATTDEAGGKSKSSSNGYAKHHVQDIFQEAKKHLSERLRSVTLSEIVECRESVRSLGRILCLTENDSCSSPVASKLNAKHGFFPTERTSSPRISVKDEQPDVFVSKVPSEPMNVDINPDRNSEREALSFSSMASPPHNQIIKSSFDISPSSPISPQQVLNRINEDKEHQSPVSVLDPLPMEDASSSKSIITQSPEGALHPLRIDHEEYALVLPIDLEHKSIAACRAALKATCLNSEDAPLTKSHCNTELLVDCVNDVLLELYEQQLEIRTSYLKPTTRSFPLEDHLVSELVKRVKSLLILQLEQPTLDKLVGHDIARSAWWLDTRLDTEDVVSQIAEDVLEESVLETLLMFCV